MSKPIVHQANVYAELYPVSSAVLICAAVITMVMGAPLDGVFCLFAGVALGVASALHRGPAISRAIKKDFNLPKHFDRGGKNEPGTLSQKIFS